MFGFNRVFLLGNIGSIELLTTKDGAAMVKISLATNRPGKNAAGERENITEWHNLVFYNVGNYRLADIAGEYLQKGQAIGTGGGLLSWRAECEKLCARINTGGQF
jgi:single-strand DNA-binding protein